MKQLFCASNVRDATIEAALESARRDAKAVHPLEATHRFGGLLLSARAGGALNVEATERIITFAKSATFAWCFEGGSGPVWLILAQV